MAIQDQADTTGNAAVVAPKLELFDQPGSPVWLPADFKYEKVVDISQPMDGVSIARALRDGSSPERDALFWHYPHYHPGGATPYSAVRVGDWKLIHFFEDDHIELYNLAKDLSEKTDLTLSEPERVKAMRLRLDQWLKAVGAQLPTPNPAFDPAKEKGAEKKK